MVWLTQTLTVARFVAWLLPLIEAWVGLPYFQFLRFSRNLVSQLPLPADLLPEVRRPGFVAQFQKPVGVHAHVVHDFLEVLIGELSVELVDEGYRLFPGQMFVAYFL